MSTNYALAIVGMSVLTAVGLIQAAYAESLNIERFAGIGDIIVDDVTNDANDIINNVIPEVVATTCRECIEHAANVRFECEQAVGEAEAAREACADIELELLIECTLTGQPCA
jgi:hypothetical protein